jgi:anaerobic dimethyl sulfoxide reductase subunit B (iron-sulfur subunit)
LCADLVERGERPACVAACPMRALDFGEIDELRSKYGTAVQVHPLPEAGMTEPSLVVRPHRDAKRAAEAAALVKNREEV